MILARHTRRAAETKLLENEMSEIKIINEFLPKQLSEEETKKYV